MRHRIFVRDFVKKRKKEARGLTLVELIVVLGIITILAGGVLFNFSGFSSKTFATDKAFKVKSLINTMRQKIKEGGCEKVDFEFEKKEKGLSGEAKCFKNNTEIYSQDINLENIDVKIYYEEPNGLQPLGAFSFSLANKRIGELEIESIEIRKEGGNLEETISASSFSRLWLSFKKSSQEAKINLDKEGLLIWVQ